MTVGLERQEGQEGQERQEGREGQGRRQPSYSSQVRVDVSGLSHKGHVRSDNEDHFLVARLGRTFETMITSLPDREVPDVAEEVNYVMIVADGMGGHLAGEVASRMALSAIVSIVLDIPDWIFKLDAEHARTIEQRTRARIREVGAMLVDEGQRDPALSGMGTTLTAARSLGRDLQISHVGDSRAYLFRAGRLHRLTRDHTYAQLLVDLGRLPSTDHADPRQRHVLTNALGGADREAKVDIDLMKLEDGDRVMLCSDGLTDMVDDQAIAGIIADASASQPACEALMKRALDNGGRDNVTVIVAAYQLPEI
jgi:PPM family protein phosphatase